MADGTPLAEPGGASGTLDSYEAIRTDSGWQTIRRLTPSGAQAVFPNAGGASSDHQYAFTEAPPSGGSLAEDGSASYLVNPDGSFEVLGVGSLGEERLSQGRYISPGGAHIIFSTGGFWCTGIGCEEKQLEPDAAPTGTAAIYDRSADGPTHVISLLPGDEPLLAGEVASYQGVSADGSVVAFKVAGVLYARINDAVTKEVASSGAAFAGVSADDDQIFYASGGNIYVFDISTGISQQINLRNGSEVLAEGEIANISADGSHVYFLSTSVLSGLGGETGNPNLYVWTAGGGIRYVASVAPADLAAHPNDVVNGEPLPALNRWTWTVASPETPTQFSQGPGGVSARSTPDGNVLVFESRAQLTADPTNGQNEIYRYDAVSQTLSCVSCNPSGVAPSSGARLEALHQLQDVLGGAAVIIHSVTDDGSRVFFETSEPLVARDVDGVNDIYEWEKGSGVSLISSGQSAFYTSDFDRLYWEPNIIFGIRPEGEDVVFRTTDQLVPQAGVQGVPALYDARVNGGFPSPVPAPSCDGEACRDAASEALPLSRPRSDRVASKGNVKVRCGGRHRNKIRKHRRGRHEVCPPHRRKHHRGGAR